jgi:hypothetical protein
MLSNIWVWDPGSRGQKGTGSRIRIRNTDLGYRYVISFRLVFAFRENTTFHRKKLCLSGAIQYSYM